MEFKNIGKHMSEYFRYRLGQKTVAFILLLFFNFNIFSEIVPDPASIGTKVTRTASGVDQIDIARPNVNGTSYNSLRELQVGERGLILNNNKNVVVQTEIAGLVARNRNLDNGTEANLIITEITGKNRTGINGYVEVAGKRADIVIANRNGIHVNGGGFLNSDRVTLTTGRLNMENGDLKSIDVTEGKVSIGEKGVDVLSLSDFELIGKTVDISGIIKGSKDTRVLISTGGQTYEYKTKKVTGKGETYEGIAVDGKAAGSMYAGKIDIISNDKGAGVNTKGDLVSIDDVTITANGDITTNKVHSEKRVVYNTTKKVKIRKQTTAGKQVTVRAKKTEIDVDAKVITGYLEKALGEASFKAEGEEVNNKGEIQAEGRINIKSRLTENSGEMYSTVKTEIEGEKLDNSRGTLKSDGKIDINTSETVNREGYILSDGLTKEEVQKEEASAAENMGAPKEHGVNISGKLDNTRGVIRGRDITVGGDLVANEKGQIRTSGNVNLNGKNINNARGEITGNIGKLNAERLINDDGKLTSSKRLEGIIKETSNRNGEIYGSEGIKIIGEKLSNLSGTVRSDRKINLEVNMTDNTGGHILSDGITKEEVEKDREEKKEETGKKAPELSEAGEGKEHGVNISGKLDNTRGVIRGRDITVGGDLVANEKGQIRTSGNVNLNGKNINNARGEITGNIGKLNAERLINDDGKLTSSKRLEGIIKETSNRNGEIYGSEGIKIIGEKLSNLSGTVRSDRKINLEVNMTDNTGGHILSDGITKEEVEKDREEKKEETGKKAPELSEAGEGKEHGVNISGKLDNTRGVIRGRDITVGGDLVANEKGQIRTSGNVNLNGKNINNARGEITGNIGKLNAERLINDDGKLTSSKRLEGIIKETSNRNGEIYGSEGIKIIGEKLSNLSGTVRSDRKINLEVNMTDNTGGHILSDGITKEEVEKDREEKKEETGKKAPELSEAGEGKEHGVNISGKLDNTRGVIRGRDITVGGDLVANEKGQIRTSGNVNLNGKSINNARGEITGNIGKLNAERLINDDGKLTSIDKIEGEIKEISNIRGEILGEESIKIIGEKLNNFSGVLRSGKNIETELKELNNREGYILKDGITKEEAQKWAVQKIAEKSEKSEEKPSSEEVKQQDGEKDRKYASAGPNAIRKVEPSISAERLDNTRGIIASLTGTYIKTSDISNSDGKVVSRNEVVLDMPSDYTYEGLVAGDVSTVIRAGTVTVNGKMDRSDALTLVGKHGVNLKDDITARVLTLDTGSSVLNNARNIRGEEGLSISSLNIINEGNILSGGTLLVNARGKVYNSATGLMSGKNVHVDAGMIENNRGKILSDGSLSLIAETLIRNDNGIVDSKDEMYLKVANGRLENTGTSEILIDYVKKQTGTQPETKKKTFGRRAVMVLDEAVQEQERVLNINMKDSVIRSGKNLYMDINGDVINSDGGKITAAEELGIKANNVYNIGKYIQDVQKNELVSGAGGRIEAGKVFLEVKGKVVNGTEDYLTGAYRRGDGVLIDNRQVTSISPSEIKGREVTRIDTGELINTSHIGGTGITIVDTERNLTNASIGNAIAVIDGKEVLVDGKGGVHNIGAEIRGNEVTQVLSEKGKIVNESTVKVEKTEAPVRPERVPSFFRVFRNDTPQEMRESIRNIGKIESDGTAYVKAKNEVINIAGNIKGKNGTYVGSESGNIEDRTVTLHYEGRNVVETKTEIREIPVMKRIKFREVPTGEVRKEEVTTSTKWDHRKTTETVSGEIGDGADTVIEAGKDLILESSNIRGKDNIVLNAKNYILMLSTVNTDTKDRTETHKSGKKLGKRKTTTNSWYVDNEYVNGVDLTTDGNIVLNWDINGKKRGANKGIFAQGVNFNAKGQVGAYSDGNIYVQGTKDRIHEVFNSHTVKRFGGVKYGSKHDYVNSKIERYRHTQLYGEAGITLDSEGKLRVEGADVQSYGNVLLRGKQGVEILPGEEINSRYEEHTSKKFKISGNKNGVFAGIEKNKNTTGTESIKNVGSIINSHAGTVTVTGDHIISIGSKIGAAGDITLDGAHGVVVKDGENLSVIREQNEKMRAGAFATWNGKRLSASAGFEATYGKNKNGRVLITPEKNILVTNGNIHIKSSEGNVFLQGDFGAKENIGVLAEKGKIYVKDSKSEIHTDSESVNARIELALGINLGGIKDTLNSFKNGYKALKEIPNVGRVGSFIKDIVKGKSLLESLEGREKTINAMSTLFNGPSTGGVSAGAGVAVSIDSAKSVSDHLQNITTNMRAGKDIALKSKEFETYGSFIRAENDLGIDAEKITVQASEDSYSAKGKSMGANFGITFMGAEAVSAGMNYGEMKAEGTTYNNSQIQAGNRLTVTSDSMKIRGGKLQGRHTDVDVKGDLLVESLQDREKMKQVGVNAGYSYRYGKSGDGSSDGRSSGNIGGNYAERDRLWVKEQSGITGTESITVKTGGKLTLIGSIIANVNGDKKDGGNLTLSYGELESSDLHNYDKMVNISGNIEVSQRSKDNNTNIVLNKNRKRNEDVIEVPNRTDETYGIGIEGYDKQKITRSTIGNGTINGEKTPVIGVNRDITKADGMLKDIGVKRTEFLFKSEPASWGDFNRIISSSAGAIGDFLDDFNERGLGKARTNYEAMFRNSVNKKITEIERPLDKINRFISILPTSGTHGGILEQVVRTIRYDKTPIIKVSVRKNEKDDTVEVSMEELKKISDYKPENGEVVKVNTNGIIELKQNAARNTIFKNMTKEDMEKYNRRETVNYIMVYNPTRGAVADIIESALGKMFDGSLSSLGLSIGVNRGAAVAYASRDRNQSYDFSFYSQGNIVGLGAFNILQNNGIKLGNGDNFKVRMYGTPVTKKTFEEFEPTLGIEVVGAAVNEPDFVGSNGKWKGIVGERRPVLGVYPEDIARLKRSWKDSKAIANTPVLKAILREEPGAVLAVPKLVSEEEKEKYKENPSEWMKKNGYSIPVTSSDLEKITENYKFELKDKEMTDNHIMKKMLNDGHGAYTYYSAIYAGELDNLLRKYEKADKDERASIERAIERKYIETQEALIELYTRGPAILNDSKGLLAGLNRYNELEQDRVYREGKYMDKGLPSNYVTNSLNIGIRVGKIGAGDIGEYLKSLRNGVGLR